MSQQDNLNREIHLWELRLQKLKEKRALQGISVDPSVELEIEDIEKKLTVLRGKANQTAFVPLYRPYRIDHFVGREKELAELVEHLKPSQVVTLCGPGGIGKTALAAEAIWHLSSNDEPPTDFPDGVFYYNFYHQSQVEQILQEIASDFEIDPTQGQFKKQLKKLLMNKRALLIFDGTEEADNLDELLEIRGGCGLLITSRRREDAKIGIRQDIKPLPLEEAVTLLEKWGQKQVRNHQAAKEICQIIGKLPLAICLVGRYLDQTALMDTEYLEWLVGSPLQALPQGRRNNESILFLIERSLGNVSEQAQQVLAVIGILALASFGVEPIVAALKQDITRVRQVLGELVNYGLLIRIKGRYEVSHALIYTYIRKQTNTDNETVKRLGEYYVNLAQTKSDYDLEIYKQLDIEREHFLKILEACFRQELWALTQLLIQSIRNYLEIRGHWLEYIQTLEIGVKVAKQLDDKYDEGRNLNAIGSIYSAKGAMEKAINYYQQSLILTREIGDKKGEGNCLAQIGVVYCNLGQVEKAIEFHQEGLTIVRKIGDERGEATLLAYLGFAYSDLGQLKEAIFHYEQSLTITRKVGNRRWEGVVLGNLATAYSDIGKIKEAISYYEQALDIAQEIGDRRNEGAWLGNLGLIYNHLGRVEKAIKYHKQALHITQDIGNRFDEGIFWGNLGKAYYIMKQMEQAVSCYQQALTIARETGYRRGEGTWLGLLGLIHYDLSQIDQAIENYEQALNIAREIDNRKGEGFWLHNLGDVYQNMGKTQKAIEHYKQAIAIAQEIGNRENEVISCWSLGLLYQNTNPAYAVSLMSLRVAYEQEVDHIDAKMHSEQLAKIKEMLA